MSILVALDFSPPSRNALASATELARSLKVPLLVVHAYGRAPAMPPGAAMDPIAQLFAEGKMEEARRLTSEVLEPLEAQGIDVELVAREGSPKRVLGDAIEEHRPSLVVCGHHSNGLRLGSIAKWLLDEAGRPVVVVPG